MKYNICNPEIKDKIRKKCYKKGDRIEIGEVSIRGRKRRERRCCCYRERGRGYFGCDFSGIFDFGFGYGYGCGCRRCRCDRDYECRRDYGYYDY